MRSSRRDLLAGAVGSGVAAVGAGRWGAMASTPARELSLVAAETPVRLPGAAGDSRIWSYGPGAAPPVVRVRRGEAVRAVLTNRLPEHTAIHWHGLRVPNAMDGVPWVTQPPVRPGESFTYDLAPPDTGTFFFHPHCDTAQQLGRGLAGVLIVEGDTDHAFDADLVLAVKDWDLQPDGTLGPFLTTAAGNAGTYGTLTTVNGQACPEIEVAAGADLRLRVLNLDSTRILDLAIEGAEAWVIATDGNGLPPFPLAEWRMGPAMRVDLALHAPFAEGAVIELRNNRAAQPIRLASLRTTGPARRKATPFAPPTLMHHLPEPDLATAATLPILLSTGAAATAPAVLTLPDGTVLDPADGLCASPRTFWAINRATWPEAQNGRMPIPPPLATLARGRSYVLELQNTSKVIHPMHLHGHSFKVLDSSTMTIVPHWADTTLVHPRERRRVAFVADNPGLWMLHCHVIEHQETGMMAVVRVA